MDSETSLEHQALIEHFFVSLKKALQFVVKLEEQTQHTRNRFERLLRTVVTTHLTLVESNLTVEFTVQRTKILFGSTELHDDDTANSAVDDDLPQLAAKLHSNGLRSLLVKPKGFSLYEAERLVKTLAQVFSNDNYAGLSVELWRLGLPQLEIRVVDKLDTTFWRDYSDSELCTRLEFIDQFYFRVRQSLSPHLVKARGLFARRTLEGGVQGDSLSLESQFNKVFRRRDSSEQLKAGEWDERNYEPTIIEKLTATLGQPGKTKESEGELRGLLREQLKRHPQPADDKTLIRRAISACRFLDSTDTPTISIEESSKFFQNIVETSVVIGDFQFFSEILTKIISVKEPSFAVQVVQDLCENLSTVAFINSLQTIIRQNVVQFGLEKTRAQLSQLLSHLEPAKTLKAITKVYPDIADDGTRMAFQDYLVTEGASSLSSLKPIFESRDSAIMTEGFGILSLIGPKAVPLIQLYVSDNFEERRQLAWKALQLASGSSALLLRDQHLENLYSDRLEKRKISVEWLIAHGQDEEVFAAVSVLVKQVEFLQRDREEQQLLIDLLTRSGGEKAVPVLSQLPELSNPKHEKGGTRRVADAKSRIENLGDDS